MARMSNEQKRINVDLATRIDKKSAARTEQDINNLIKAASATPIKIKIDDSDFKKLELAISDVETVLRRLGRDLKLDTESMNGRSIKGFIGLRESIVETLNVLNRFNETLYVPQNSNRSWIKTDVDGFYELSTAIIGAAKDTQAFNDQLKHISKSGGLIGVLEKISKLLSEIGEKLDIKQVRLPETIKEEVNVAEAAVKELENSLIRLGEGRLKKNGNESVIKYFTEMTANAQKAAEQVLSGNYDIPTSGFNRFIKELGTAMNLPNEELNKLSINIDGVEHKLVEFWNVFIENARKVKSNGELEFPTLGVKFGRDGAPDVQTLPILKEIDKLKEARTVLADLNKEYKDATSYVKRDFNVGLDQASIDALKGAVQSIGSINVSLGEGTVLEFKSEQVEAVTGAFNDLKGVVQEIANILRQTFGASSVSSTSIEETTNQITGATWAYTRLTGVLQQVKKEETTTASAPAFGINQDQVNSIISSLGELLELIRQIQSALVGTEAEGPLQTLTTNIQTLASSLQNFDIFKGGKSLNASQIQQVADVVLNKMKEFGSVAADDKQKVQELAEVATELTQATSGIQTVQYPPAIADQWTKNLYNTKTVEEEIISAQEKLNSSVAVGSGEIKKETAEAQRLFDILKSDVNHGATPFDLATKQGVIESIKQQADEYETATRKALELAEAERKIQEERLRVYAQKAFQKDTGVGLNQFDQITRSGVAEAINRMTSEYEQSTRKAVELAEANRRIAESEAATQAWITDLQAAGEGASLATQKVNELNAAMANADAGYGLEPVIQEFELEAQAIENAKQKLEEAKNALIQFKEAGGDVKSDQGKQLAANVKAAQKEYDKLTNVEKYHKDLLKEIAKEQQQAASASIKSANEQKRSADQVIKTLEKQIELAEIFMAKSVENGNVDLLGERYNEFVKKVHDLKGELSDLKNDVKIGNISSEGLEKAKNSASGLKVELAGMEAAAKTAKQGLDKMADPQKIDTLIRRIETFKTVNEHLSSGTVARLDGILNTLRTSGELTDIELKKLVNDFANIGHQAAQAGEIGANWFDGWKKRLASLSQYLTTFVSFYRIVGYVRESFNIVKELDTALIDLKKTARMTAEEFEGFYFDSNKVAKEMGVTTKEIIEQASSWSRLGYNTAEAASTMAALSSKFASVSPGMGTEEAQTGLVSIMKAWDVLPENVERDVIDKINILGNRFAETNKDIIGGMERAGATLSAIGMDISDSFALFTGAQEVIQNAETVGTAIKTLSLRIRGKYHCLHMVKAICYVV